MIGDALLIAALFLIPGYAVLIAFGAPLNDRLSANAKSTIQEKLTFVEVLYLIVSGGVVIVLWLGMLLAEFSIFSLALLLGVVLGGSMIVGGWAFVNGRSLNPFRGVNVKPISILLLLIFALAIWLSSQPFEYINGGRDHGIYVNTGINIARTGGILVQDEDLTAVPIQSRQLLTNPEVSITPEVVPGPWSEGQRLPGMTIRSLDQGVIAPHAFHLYPVFIAIFAVVGGVEFALLATAFLGLWGLLGVYMVGTRLFGQPVGLITFLLLTISLAQFWYMKAPSAEILLQPLFWSGLFTLLLMLETQSKYTAILAGLSFGLMHLAKLDTVFVPLILFVFFLYRWFRYRFQAADWFFIVVYGIVVIQSALHAFFIATIYFLDQITRVLLPDVIAQLVVRAGDGYTYPSEILKRLISQNIALIIIGIVGIGLLLWTMWRFRPSVNRQLARIEKYSQRGQGILAIFLGLSLMGIYLIQSFTSLEQVAKSWQFLLFSNWYLTPLGLFLGTIGLMYVGNLQRKYLNIIWLILVIHVFSLFVFGVGTFPDQFWAIRRFVPIVLPALILFAAYVLWDLMPESRSYWIHILLPFSLIVVLVVGQVKNIRPFLGFVDYKGMIEQVDQLNASFPEDAVLLFEKGDAANRVTLPLWFIHNRTVFILEEGAISDPDFVPAIEKWWEDGRDVFWLGNGSVSPEVCGDVVANYEGERFLNVLLAEGPVGRLPKNVGLFLETFDVHRLVMNDSEEIQYTNTHAVGRGDNGIKISGLYPPESLPSLTPRRWTSGQVTIELPVTDQLTEIVLQMGNSRPVDVSPADVSVYLDDYLLDTVQVRDAASVYKFAIPQQIDLPGEMAVLRLEMEPWIPVQTGHSADQRELGVLLDWIKLISTKPNN